MKKGKVETWNPEIGQLGRFKNENLLTHDDFSVIMENNLSLLTEFFCCCYNIRAIIDEYKQEKSFKTSGIEIKANQSKELGS